VLVGEDDSVDGPFYIRNPFEREPECGESSINYKLSDLLSRADLQSLRDKLFYKHSIGIIDGTR
jgi:hypothetical protein